MLILLDFTTLVADAVERPIGSDGSPYEKRVDAKGRVLSDKCIADEVPFEELPEGWCWARLESVCTLVRGSGIKRADITNEGLPCIRYGELYTTYDTSIATVASHTGEAVFSASKKLEPDEVLITLTGENNVDIGRAVFNDTGHTLAFGGDLLALKGRNVRGDYLAMAINSSLIGLQRTKASTGNIIVHLSATKASQFLVPIPPLAEQRHIVERVGELMPLVEEYGGLEDAREVLDAALPGRLRKSVLQLAVQGGLVPQDPTDEPAGVLLERVRGQRRQLVAEGKMRAPKGGESIIFAGSDGRRYEKRIDARGRESEPVCIDDEIPFEIPAGWEWARLGSVFTKMGSGSTPAGGRKVYRDEGPMLIRSQNVHNEGLRLDDVAHFAYSLFAKRGSHVLPNDMLLNITGASIGRCAIVPNTFGDADVNQHVLIMRPVSTTFSEYLHAAIISPLVQSAIMAGQVGATKEGLSATKAAHLLIPLPPLAEQRRIVDVVDRLFKILA